MKGRPTQLPAERPLQDAAALHKQTAVDRFIGDLHCGIARVGYLQPAGDWLR